MTMRAVPTFTACLVALCVTTAGVCAAVTVHRVDGQVDECDTVSLVAGKVTGTAADGAAVGTWDIDDVARIDFTGPDAPAADAAEDAPWVRVVGGKLRGAAQSFDGKVFAVTGTDFGDLDLPVACVEALLFGDTAPAQLDGAADAASDVIVLRNMDRLSGTLNGMDDKTVRFHSDLGDLTLDRERVAAVRIGTPPGGRPKRVAPVLRLALAGGTEVELSGVTLTADGNGTGTLLGGPQVAFPVAQVLRIAVVGGRLAYLETFEPSAYEQYSLDILKWDIKSRTNVLGGPMRLRRRKTAEAVTFDHGIGVHGPCRIVYPLNGQYERFIALAGVDEAAGQWADANLVVKVDGKERFRADHVKWREPARPINLAVAGARRIELVVEAADHFDVQDRINWADARLIRNAAHGGK